MRRAAAAPGQRAQGERTGAVALARAVLARSLRVKNPAANIPNPGGTGVIKTNGDTIREYLDTICAGGTVAVDAGTGDVTLSAGFCVTPVPPQGSTALVTSPAQSSATRAGCNCLCDLIGSAHDWRIEVNDAAWPETKFDSDWKAKDKKNGSGGKVTAPSLNSQKVWGTATATATGAAYDTPSWLVLAHELCGHAWLGDQGMHGPDHKKRRGEGGHQFTVDRENLIRGEHQIPLRGSFKDPNCGESYFRDQQEGAIQWSNYRDVCIAWRKRYNRKHGTQYTINDRIP